MAPSTKVSSKKQAQKAAKAVAKGVNGNKVVRVRTDTTFHRPKTLRLARAPKYQRKAVAHYPRMDEHKIIISHVNSEGAIKKIEDANTLVLKVHVEANKHQIKQAVKKLYDVDVEKVNTLIRPDRTKKAFVRLTADHDALDVASRAGYL
ncbi:large ribosomal subunit protein uL23 [Trichomonascus vanleenenianus]|uniref:60S ribosomal protein uL23 RPL25 n=1 Tax=Trichomonascus vanleenenianus TaxID=2268995 RepID=UPI003EC95BE5